MSSCGPARPLWEDYLEQIADVAGRADRTTILVAVEDGRILGSATLELDGRIDEDEDGPLAPGEAHIRMLGVAPRGTRPRRRAGRSCPPARTSRASVGHSDG